MKRVSSSRGCWGLLVLAGSMCATLAAADGPKPNVPVSTKSPPRHAGFLKIAKAGGVDIVFFGDSITDGWRGNGKEAWNKYFAPLKAANFGIGSEGTSEVLWRIQNGELEGIHPKLIVLLIGTNNVGAAPAEDIAQGVKMIITEIQIRSPGTRILLHGIFPKGPRPGAGRERIEPVNALLATFANPDDHKRVVYMDIGAKFLNEDQTVNKELMPDTLHPSPKGYQVWADAIIETITQQLEKATRFIQ